MIRQSLWDRIIKIGPRLDQFYNLFLEDFLQLNNKLTWALSLADITKLGFIQIRYCGKYNNLHIMKENRELGNKHDLYQFYDAPNVTTLHCLHWTGNVKRMNDRDIITVNNISS